MAKKSAKQTHKKKKPAKVAKKKRIAKKSVKTTGKSRAIKGSARKTLAKTVSRNKPAARKPSAKVARKATKRATISRTKPAARQAGRKPGRLAVRNPSIAAPLPPAQPVTATQIPTPAVSPPQAMLPAVDVTTNQGADMAEGLQPGQRVRHRYEHWWGTIVRMADNAGSTMADPAPVRYVVTVDGGQYRDDIRPEDLTVG